MSAEEMMALVGYRTLHLAAGAEDRASVAAVVDGNAVMWQWHTDDKDVQFHAVFEPSADATSATAGALPVPTLVQAELRDKTHKGWFVPPVAGSVVLHFSNKHSRFTSKTVHVRLSAGHSVGECRIRSLRAFTDRKLAAASHADAAAGAPVAHKQ